jgi:hypothetical protein
MFRINVNVFDKQFDKYKTEFISILPALSFIPVIAVFAILKMDTYTLWCCGIALVFIFVNFYGYRIYSNAVLIIDEEKEVIEIIKGKTKWQFRLSAIKSIDFRVVNEAPLISVLHMEFKDITQPFEVIVERYKERNALKRTQEILDYFRQKKFGIELLLSGEKDDSE